MKDKTKTLKHHDKVKVTKDYIGQYDGEKFNKGLEGVVMAAWPRNEYLLTFPTLTKSLYYVLPGNVLEGIE